MDLHIELSLLTEDVRLLSKAELNNTILKALLKNNLIVRVRDYGMLTWISASFQQTLSIFLSDYIIFSRQIQELSDLHIPLKVIESLFKTPIWKI